MIHQTGRVRADRRLHARFAQVALLLSASLGSAAAQADVLLQQNFSSGLGGFTSTGTVTTGSYGARMQGSLFGTDGAIVSAPFSTVGFINLTLNFSRSRTGLDSGEAGIVEYSTNGSTYTALESSATASGATVFALPASLTGQPSLRLRFRVNANSTAENFTVASVSLEGTASIKPKTRRDSSSSRSLSGASSARSR